MIGGVRMVAACGVGCCLPVLLSAMCLPFGGPIGCPIVGYHCILEQLLATGLLIEATASKEHAVWTSIVRVGLSALVTFDVRIAT